MRSGAVALRADGGLPSWCRPDSSAFCRLAPGYVFASALTRVSGAAENRGGRRMAPAPEPAAALWPREGPFQRADTQVRPYGRTRDRHRLVGADLCVGPCPAREGQRQRRSTLDVSGTSPSCKFPQGQRVSVPDCRTGTPAFSRRRQEVRAGADRPAETFFLFHRARRILFLMFQKENGGRICTPSAWRFFRAANLPPSVLPCRRAGGGLFTEGSVP